MHINIKLITADRLRLCCRDSRRKRPTLSLNESNRDHFSLQSRYSSLINPHSYITLRSA